MKIGIITFWNSNDNYGQLLQAWALQKWLKRNGHNPFIIKYTLQTPNTPLIKKIAIYFFKTILIYPIFVKLFNIIKQKKRLQINHDNLRQFNRFRNDELIFSKNEYNCLIDLQKFPPEADCYITGSDQVWAQLLSFEENQAYFLNFGNEKIKRIAYAPSFSMLNYPPKLINKLQQQLKKFNAISVREKTGLNICNKAGFKAETVCDPTLLLNANDYADIIEKQNNTSNYIYIYSLNISSKKDIYWDELYSFASNHNLKIRVTTASGYIPAKEIFNKKHVEYDYATISKWLFNIQNAQLVVTSSFHGIVFSIIMHTPFIYIPLKGKFSKGNNRITDLLDYLELNHRILKTNTTFTDIYNSKIHWNKVFNLLNTYQEKSKLFLIKNLNKDS
mgnify:CR=1 FL=1